jgi:hypothetical protein
MDAFAPRYLDRAYDPVGGDLLVASCRLRIEGRESGVGIDRDAALVCEFDEAGLLRRGWAYNSRAEALGAAKERADATA